MYNEKRHKSNKICRFLVIVGSEILDGYHKNCRLFSSPEKLWAGHN